MKEAREEPLSRRVMPMVLWRARIAAAVHADTVDHHRDSLAVTTRVTCQLVAELMCGAFRIRQQSAQKQLSKSRQR